MMKPMPMPMRPRLPPSSSMLSLASKANPVISKELADVACDSQCSHTHHHEDKDHNQKKRPHDQEPEPTSAGTTTSTSSSTCTGSTGTPPVSFSGLNKAEETMSCSGSTSMSEVKKVQTHHVDPLIPCTSTHLLSYSLEEHTPIPLMEQPQPQWHGASFSSLDFLEFDDDQPELMDLQESFTTICSQVDPSLLITTQEQGVAKSLQGTTTSMHDMMMSTSEHETSITSASGNTMLHQTCLLFPQSAPVVRTALLECPPAALIPSQVPLNGYTFPLHIAISHAANLPVVQMLAQAGPCILLQQDGPLGLTPLAVALHWILQNKTSASTRMMRNVMDVLRFLLSAQPKAAGIPCGPPQDLPLHMACRYHPATPLQLEIVEALIPANTGALVLVNRQGLTPMDLLLQQQQRDAQDNEYHFRVLSCLKFAANMTRPSLPTLCSSAPAKRHKMSLC
ncbi:expressed unknown protein [Seminavis robusta]|uniref:Uncharacterized protein n=1 Tax=Seminavis robusta TaxID=568900 RepID=A0A9N8DR61_9STRA|nr:expressed unknown protein [Seminavis robusta]|eukprot:Sro280_g107040.1 n/a (451) ;mRNA; f:41685-43037